jgi:hypothetical protein
MSAAEVGQDAGEMVKARQRPAPRPPTGKSEGNPKGGVDPVERFKQLTETYKKAGEPKGQSEEEISSFLSELSDEDEQTVRKWFSELPWAHQDDLYEIFKDLDSLDGPAASLMKGIHKDRLAFQDRLPTPPPVVDPKWAEEQTVAILRAFLPEDKAREIAAEPRPSDEDLMRAELHREAVSMYGDTPEAVETAKAALAEYRRQGKWIAVCDAVEPAESASRVQARNKGLRTLVPKIAKLAAKAAQDLPALLVTPGNAATVKARVILPLLGKLEEARLVADIVPWAEWLVDKISRGEFPTADDVLLVARGLTAVTEEAHALGKRLARGRGQPPKPAVDGAVALDDRGLDPRQIDTVLDRKNLRLDPDPALNTPAHYRRAIRQRRARADTK